MALVIVFDDKNLNAFLMEEMSLVVMEDDQLYYV